MFIDKSYFTGPLTIAQLGQQSVVDNLNDFINRYEETIMVAACGYDFYQSFLAGVELGSDEIMEQRWANLLNGCVFTSVSGIKKRFKGFASGTNSSAIIVGQRDDLFIYGGITPGFAVNGNSYTDISLKDWNYSLEIFGAGTVEPGVVWDPISTGGIKLTDTNYQVQYGEQWVIHFIGKKLQVVSSGASYNSPLAGFIYYEYMKDLATQNTGVGIVKSESENARPISPIKKMCYAYNDAVEQIRLFWEIMQADQNLPEVERVYPEFNPQQVIGYYYGCYNMWSYWYNYRGVEDYSFRFVNPFGI